MQIHLAVPVTALLDPTQILFKAGAHRPGQAPTTRAVYILNHVAGKTQAASHREHPWESSGIGLYLTFYTRNDVQKTDDLFV